jgi:hypothetical protein
LDKENQYGSSSERLEVAGATNRASNERIEKQATRITEYRQYMEKQKQLLQTLNQSN